MNNSRVIRHSDFELAVNLEWVYVDHSIKLPKFVSNTAYERGASYAYFNKQSVAFGKETSNGKPALAQVFIAALKPVKAVVFLKLDSVANDFGKDHYWFCAFDEKGRVIPASDLVLAEDGIRDNLLDPIYEGFDIFTTSDSVEDESSYKIFSLDEVVAEYASNKDFFVKPIESGDKKKNRVIAGSVAAAVGLGLYFTVLQVDPLFEEIQNGDYNQGSASSKAYVSKLEKKYNLVKSKKKRRGRGTPEVTQEDVVKIAEDAIFTKFSNVFYSNDEIFENILKISNTYPEEILDWNLEMVVYEGNSFYFNYKKGLNNGKSFRDLDAVVNEYTRANGLIAQPSQLLDNGSNRLYEVVYNSPKRDEMVKMMLEKNRQEQEQKVKLEKIKKVISSIKSFQSSINSHISSLDEMGWVSKRFGDTLENTKTQIEMDDRSISKAMKELKMISKEYDESLTDDKVADINPDWLSGDLMSLVNLMQKNTMVDWSYPSKENPVPSAAAMGKSALAPYAKYWDIVIKGASSSEDGGSGASINKLGAALYLFDMPNTVVNTVILQNKTKEFEIKGEYYEKN